MKIHNMKMIFLELFQKNGCCKVCRKSVIFVGAPNLTMKDNCGLGEPKPC